MKNKKSCSLMEKIVKIDYRKNAKFLILIPVLLIAFATIITCIFGINYARELEDRYDFTVDIGIELQSDKIVEYQDSINKALSNNNLYAEEYKKFGQEIYTGFVVTLDSSISSLSEDQVETIQEAIENELQTTIGNTVEVGNLMLVSADVVGFVLKAIISAIIIAIVLFVYLWIRFDIKASVSTLIANLLTVGSIFAVFGLFRLPFGYGSLAIMFGSWIICSVASVIIFDNIRNNSLDKSLTNNEFIAESLCTAKKSIIYPMACLSALSIVISLIMLIFSVSTFVLVLSFAFAIIISLYFSCYCATSFWSLIYNRDKDQRLRSRIERQKKSEEKKAKKEKTNNVDDDKLLI